MIASCAKVEEHTPWINSDLGYAKSSLDRRSDPFSPPHHVTQPRLRHASFYPVWHLPLDNIPIRLSRLLASVRRLIGPVLCLYPQSHGIPIVEVELILLAFVRVVVPYPDSLFWLAS
jgi:hypothetical protein